jgi:hypothetical protein
MRQLLGDTSVAGFLLRSTTTLTPRLRAAGDTGVSRITWKLFAPEVHYAHNNHLPYGGNDGPLWAGRGSNVSIRTGIGAQRGRVELFVVPEIIYEQNRWYRLADPPFAPVLQLPRNGYGSPWHSTLQSIDLPIRFGLPNDARRRLHPGQSSLTVNARQFAFGVATENEWWGPAIRNALILSNNAPGFPHLFLRTANPLRTRIGTFEGRWLSGWLRESDFFDTISTNQARSISMLALTWQPPRFGVVLGAARAVYAPAARSGITTALTQALSVFADVGQPNAVPLCCDERTLGRDQLMSLFFRWVEPKNHFEFYGEWGRAEFPVSLRDFLVHANHSQAYTLGLQWLGEPGTWNGRLRAQGEVTYLEQSTTFRYRRVGSWYTSRPVPQGYTNDGQVLGAAIGPGSSSQFVGLDYIAPRWQAGTYLTRVRWLEDARSQQDPYLPTLAGEHGWCEHDVSFLSGFRAAATTRIGTVKAEYSTGWRLNVFFENYRCDTRQRRARDVRNNSLFLTFTPLSF